MNPKVTLTPSILLVQTDRDFTERASQDLSSAGYHPVIVPTARAALSEFKILQPAMIILDRQRSGKVGLKLCRDLRKASEKVLILMLVPQESVDERIACLEAGADDYLLTTYHPAGLIQRVNFYLRATPDLREQLRFGEMVLDLSSRRLFVQDNQIELTMKEFELLKYLMSHPREVVTREQILDGVWGYDFRGESNVIEVYIRYLRLKLETQGQKRLIHTVRGVGYVLRDT
jgi:DNA-binding response OmpR family regulator